VILRRDGQTWVDETPRGLPQMSGIWVTPDGTAYAAGFNGHLYVRKDGVWSEFEEPPTFQDFHAIWVDDQGGIWAVGGRLAADPPRDGVLVYYGPPLPEGIGP
jgi:streptogramin lyase